MTLTDCISRKLRCDVHDNPFRLTWFGLRAKLTKIFFFEIFILQRQSKLDEVTGRTGEADGLGGIPATQPPLTTPLERRDIPPQLSMTLEHIVG